MKHSLLVWVLSAVLFLAVLAVGVSLLFSSTVTDVTRATLTSGAAGESAVNDISFSPLTRRLTVTGWRRNIRGSDGTVSSASMGSFSAVLPFRALAAVTPVLSTLIHSPDDSVPVLSDLQVRDVAWSGPSSSGSFDALDADELRLRFGLLQQYLAGLKPPFAQSVDGLRAGHLRKGKTAIDFHNPRDPGSLRYEALEVWNLRGSNADRLVLHRPAVSSGSEPAMAAESLEMEKIHVSPALISELVANPVVRQGVAAGGSGVIGALIDNGPVAARTVVRNFSRGMGRFTCTMDQGEVLWTQDQALRLDSRIRGLRIPLAAIKDIPFEAQGIDTIVCDADHQFTAGETVHDRGIFRLKDLGDFSCEFTLLPGRDAFRDLVLTWRDYGLTPRIARSISPDANAAAMLMKTMAARLCRADKGEAREQCARLGAFADAPGTLRLRTAPGKLLSFWEFFALWGNFGSLFQVETVPGPATLRQQTEALFPAGAR